jgi:hypothetical protein
MVGDQFAEAVGFKHVCENASVTGTKAAQRFGVEPQEAQHSHQRASGLKRNHPRHWRVRAHWLPRCLWSDANPIITLRVLWVTK